MRFDHFNARCLFIDGPIMLSVCEAPAIEILDAYERLFRMLRVAAVQLEEAQKEKDLADGSGR